MKKVIAASHGAQNPNIILTNRLAQNNWSAGGTGKAAWGLMICTCKPLSCDIKEMKWHEKHALLQAMVRGVQISS